MFISRQKLIRWPVALVTVAMTCLLVPLASAQATTRYAAPDGSAANAPCAVKASPCDIQTAMDTSLQEGDTLLLAPGTYQPTAQLQTAQDSVTISGEPGEPAPLVETVDGHGLWFQGASSTVRDVRVKAPYAAEEGLFMSGEDGLVERVEVTGEAFWACAQDSGTVKDSLCASTLSDGSSGLHSDVGSVAPVTKTLTLSNLTAIGTENGFESLAGPEATLNIHVFNSIAAGGEHDVSGDTSGPAGRLDIELSHSNFAGVFTEGEEISVTYPTESGNQSAPPLFVDPATGNYAEQSGSPTRSAGTLSAPLGELDLAGNPRTTDCEGVVGVDIGAYQLTDCPPPSGGGGGSGGSPNPGDGSGGSTSGSGPTANTSPPPSAPVVPKLTTLALKPSRFETTTTITFTLSVTAKVKVEVLQKKKQSNGKTKTVKVGTLPQISGKSGTNKVKFNGTLKGKLLAPGKYTLRATATASGLSSKPQTQQFEVLP